MITSIDQLDLDKRYTYADYRLWKFQERVELLRGRVLPMDGPSEVHQFISGNLYGVLWNYFRQQQCRVYSAPFDVRLPLPANRAFATKIDTVIQPDICVVCDLTKLDKQGCVGAPELVVEILSPGNSRREMDDKYELYQEAGVLEYWILSPQHQLAWAYHLDKDSNTFTVNRTKPYTVGDRLQSVLFPELAINLKDIFPEENSQET